MEYQLLFRLCFLSVCYLLIVLGKYQEMLVESTSNRHSSGPTPSPLRHQLVLLQELLQEVEVALMRYVSDIGKPTPHFRIITPLGFSVGQTFLTHPP